MLMGNDEGKETGVYRLKVCVPGFVYPRINDKFGSIRKELD